MRTLCCDVGTSSVRVAIFEYDHCNTLKTTPLAVATQPLTIYNRKPDFYEQKTSDIWSAFCSCVFKCLTHIGEVEVRDGKLPFDSIAFSATCSLVVVEDGTEENDVIMWMDHRAKHEAQLITETGHSVLGQFGGICSPELSLAKLFWLYRNQRTRFDSAKAFMELPDWLSYRCSQYLGSPEKFSRSLCCVTCKWGYDALGNQWPEDLFTKLGMSLDESLRDRIGRSVLRPGVRIGSLAASVAREMGLQLSSSSLMVLDSVAIASSLIDAHAGVISMLAFSSQASQNVPDPYENVFCMISGTSTCHMVLNRKHSPTGGVWGPYWEAIIPGYYLREAGQSATGKLIEHVITDHLPEVPDNMNDTILKLNQELSKVDLDHKTALIVNPTFHGNRSPVANPNLKGAIYGLTLQHSSVLDHYVATMEAIAYETRFIVEEVQRACSPISRVIVSGGLSKNDLYLQLHADVLGLELVTFTAGEANLMLAGASLIAFTAAKIETNQQSDQLVQMLHSIKTDNFKARTFKPRSENTEYHRKKYECYRELLDCCLRMEKILVTKQ